MSFNVIFHATTKPHEAATNSPFCLFQISFSECHPQLRRRTIHEILATLTANLVCAFSTPSADFNFKDNYFFCLSKGVSFRERQKQLGAWMWNSKRGELLRTLSVISDCSQRTFLTCQVLHSHAPLACQWQVEFPALETRIVGVIGILNCPYKEKKKNLLSSRTVHHI